MTPHWADACSDGVENNKDVEVKEPGLAVTKFNTLMTDGGATPTFLRVAALQPALQLPSVLLQLLHLQLQLLTPPPPLLLLLLQLLRRHARQERNGQRQEMKTLVM